MEVVIGFAVGYWVGTRQGREGLQRAIDTVREIAASPETVIDELAERRNERQAQAA